jgi:hypothetical protein
MKRHLKRRHLMGIALSAVALITATGVVLAYWTANGNGSGSANAAAGTSDVTVNQTTVLTPMYPGDTAQTIGGDFDNGNSGPVYVTQVTVSIDSVTKAVGAPAGTCDASDFTLSNPVAAVNAEIPVGTGVGAWSGPTIQFNNKPSNQDACKGATVALGFSIP